MIRTIASILLLAAAGLSCGGYRADTSGSAAFRVLVFSKTAGFRHGSIGPGIQMIRDLGAKGGFEVEATEDAEAFDEERLAAYRVVVFLNTTRDVLQVVQEVAFEAFVRGGGGFVGIHSAADTEYDWTFYGSLLGAYFHSHPTGVEQLQQAAIDVEDANHASTEGLPLRWSRTDEWYNFQPNPRGAVRVLATLDESTYRGGNMGSDHPIVWCQHVGRGRAWYTALGHTVESYSEPLFRAHVLGGIQWAAGTEAPVPTGPGPGLLALAAAVAAAAWTRLR
jgi:type 1 glutamine amidotransferase